jgi:hypothetical protein
MRARHAVSRFRLGCLSLLIAGLLAGCGGTVKEEGAVSDKDPKAGARRREMDDYMKKQQAGGTSKP